MITPHTNIRSEDGTDKEISQQRGGETRLSSVVEQKIETLQAEIREEMRREMGQIKKYFLERIENLEKRKTRGFHVESKVSKALDQIVKSQLKQEHVLRTELRLQCEHLREELLILSEEKQKRRKVQLIFVYRQKMFD